MSLYGAHRKTHGLYLRCLDCAVPEMSNEHVNRLLPPRYLKQNEIFGPGEVGEHMFQNIPEFCIVIWSPWLTGHGRIPSNTLMV